MLNKFKFISKNLINREILIKRHENYNLKTRLGIKEIENRSLRDQIDVLIRIINDIKPKQKN